MSRKSDGYSIIPNSVWTDPRITSKTVIMIYTALQSFCGGKEGTAFPSHKTLAEMVRLKATSAVKTAIDELIALGYIEKIGIHPEYRTVIYRVRLAAGEARGVASQEAGGVAAGEATNKNQGTRTNETNSSSSVSSHSSVSTRDDIQTESAQALLERELGATLIEDSATIAECGRFGCTLPAGHNQGQADIPENHQVAVTNGDHPVGMSRLTESKAREKFDPDKYDPDKAAVEQAALTKSIGQSVNAEKMSALAKARTSRPIKFPDGFHPSLVGYTEQMFKAEFSLLNYPDTLNGFIAHHMSKGDTSENWLGSFLTYAQRGQRMAVEQRSQNGDHEPAVNRAATWDAKRKQMFREQANEGEGYAAWQARMEREGVTLP